MGLARAYYDAHGMRMTVEAQSQSLLDVIDTLLGAYAGVTGHSDGFLVRLDYGQIPTETDPELRRNIQPGHQPQTRPVNGRIDKSTK